MDDFVAKVAKLRGTKNTSEFARYLGIPQTTVDGYFRGARKPSIEFVKLICVKCRISADWLLGLDEKQPGIASEPNHATEDAAYWRDLAISQQKTIADLVARLPQGIAGDPARTGGGRATRTA